LALNREEWRKILKKARAHTGMCQVSDDDDDDLSNAKQVFYH
jgi:hypothetical protein